MNGNFTFHNPTRLRFGENAMEFLKDELAAFGPTVMLSYMVVYTFMDKAKIEGKTFYPFCTHEGSGLRRRVRRH